MSKDQGYVIGEPYPFLLTVAIRASSKDFSAHHWMLIEPLTQCCKEKPVVRFDHYDPDGDPVPDSHSIVCGECSQVLPLRLSEHELYSSSPVYATSMFYGTASEEEGQTGAFDPEAVRVFVMSLVNDLHPDPLEAEVIGRDTAAQLLSHGEALLLAMGWTPVSTTEWHR